MISKNKEGNKMLLPPNIMPHIPYIKGKKNSTKDLMQGVNYQSWFSNACDGL